MIRDLVDADFPALGTGSRFPTLATGSWFPSLVSSYKIFFDFWLVVTETTTRYILPNKKQGETAYSHLYNTI